MTGEKYFLLPVYVSTITRRPSSFSSMRTLDGGSSTHSPFRISKGRSPWKQHISAWRRLRPSFGRYWPLILVTSGATKGSRGRCRIGGGESIGRELSGGKSAAGVQAKPAEPQQGRPKDGHGKIVGHDLRCPVAVPFPDYHGGDKSGHAGAEMHYHAARKIKGTQVPQPAPICPDPVSQWGIHQGRPEYRNKRKAGKRILSAKVS